MVKKKAKEELPPIDEFDPISLVTKKIQTAVLMLQSREENVLNVVCDTLYKFTEKSIENKMQLLSLGAVDHIVKLLNHENKTVKKNAVMCISSISTEVSIRLALQKCGCVESLLKLLLPEVEVICHEFSTLSLSFFAEDYVSKVEIFEKNGFPLVIALLQSPDCDVQRNAVRIVGLMLDDFRNRSMLKQLNGVMPLLNLLNSEYPVIQHLALDALLKCSNDVEFQKVLCKNDGLSKLVQILEDQSKVKMLWRKNLKDLAVYKLLHATVDNSMIDLHLSCLKCLAFALEDIESLKMIQNNGLLAKVLTFITKSINNPEMQQYGASVIAAAAKIDENRRMFNAQELEKTLISLLASENLQTAVASANALAVMAENLLCRDTIGKLGGISLTIQLLKNEKKEARETASLLLANLTNCNVNNCAIIMENKITDTLIQYLSLENSVVQSNIAICLSNFASNQNWRQDIEQHGVIYGLCEAIKSSDSNVQKNGCQALSFYLSDVESRQKLLTGNGISRVVDLLRSNNQAVCRNAFWVIVMCVVEKELVEAIVACGGLKLIQEMSLSSKANPLVQVALDRLMDNHLTMKYAIFGVLTFENLIKDIFFDAGKVSPEAHFESIEVLSRHPINHRRPILLVNPASFFKKSDSANGMENQDNICKKDSWSAPTDDALSSYIEELQTLILSTDSTKEQIVKLASFVCQKMGGSVTKTEFGSFSFELHISELKKELQSNVIPIGMVKRGIYYHRALLFKVLADHLSLICSLIRGSYGIAWNEVLLSDINENGEVELPPRVYVVDLMHEPGRLMTRGSSEAVTYQRM